MIYECHNPACVLGTPGATGRFSGGPTSRQIELLTGRPFDGDPDEVHEGVCPNCCEPGLESDTPHEPHAAEV